jgi:hypothetical protein
MTASIDAGWLRNEVRAELEIFFDCLLEDAMARRCPCSSGSAHSERTFLPRVFAPKALRDIHLAVRIGARRDQR